MGIELTDNYVDEAVARTRAAGEEEESSSFLKDIAANTVKSMTNNLLPPIKDVWGWNKKLPRNVGMGSFRALLETTETIDDIMAEVPTIESTADDVMDPAGKAPRPAKTPDVERVPPLRTMFPGVFESAHAFAEEVEANNTTADDITQGIVQFVTPFTGYLKAYGGLKQGSNVLKAAKALGAEATTAATAFDPHEGRVADLLQMGREMDNRFGALLNQISPDGSLANAYIDYMTNRENEGEWEGRWKNAVDSAAPTVAIAGLLKAIPASMKAARYGIENIGKGPVPGSPGAQGGKIGFHGTPKNFTKFSMDHAQTGAFGYGIYIAENPKLAEKYFTGPNGGVLKVDVPDEEVAGMLLRDVQFNEQPKNVKEAIHALQDQYGSVSVTILDDNGYFRTTGFADAANGSGAMLYNALSKVLGSEKAASEELLRRGISGMTYPDAANSGRNMVVFNDKLPKILARNSKAKE